jgi:hypothetical protein
LYHPETGQTFWGDLHIIADTYIFNGVQGTGQFETVPGHKVITVFGDHFERRDVWIIHVSQADLNLKAREYIKDGQR